jgi:hypothetical protein
MPWKTRAVWVVLLLAPALHAQVINVKSMPPASGCVSAKGDGLTNDAAVFACALKYAAGLSPRNSVAEGVATPQVYAPAGTYHWGGTPVVWNARVNLVGDGSNSTIFHYTGAGGTALSVAVPDQAGGNPYPVLFKGWTLHGPGIMNAGNADTGLAVSGLLIDFEDVHFRGFALATLFTLAVNPTGFITFERPYWQFNTRAILLPSLGGKLWIEQLRFNNAKVINCATVAGCATLGQPSSSGNTDVYCDACSFDNAQLRMDRVNVTCAGCHFESVDAYPGVPLVSVGSGKFNWFGGYLLVDVNGASAGVFLSDSNDATHSFANIVGVNAYKTGQAIPFVQLAANTAISLTITGVNARGAGFPTLVGGYHSGTPNGAVSPTPFLSILGQSPAGIVSRQSRGIRVIPYSPDMTLDCSLGEVFTITVTNGRPYTITGANQYPGELVVLDIFNKTTSALGAATFGSGFKAGTFTPPGPGAHRAITFLSDGTSLREIAQTAVDVPD